MRRALILVVAVSVSTVVTQEVAMAYWITNPSNGHSYSLTVGRYWGIQDEQPNVNQPDWFDAEAEAQSVGGHLVTIRNAAENAWLVSTFGGNQEFWIGLTDWGSEGIWRWASGEPVTFTNWDNGQPDNQGVAGEDCAHLNHGHPGNVYTPAVWNDLGNRVYEYWLDRLPIRGIIEVVPEPATLAMLALGGLAFARRRSWGGEAQDVRTDQ